MMKSIATILLTLMFVVNTPNGYLRWMGDEAGMTHEHLSKDRHGIQARRG